MKKIAQLFSASGKTKEKKSHSDLPQSSLSGVKPLPRPVKKNWLDWVITGR